MGRLYWTSFRNMLLRLLGRPMWLLLICSLFLMSLVYLNGTISNLPIAVVDQDHSKYSRDLIRSLNASSKIETHIYASPNAAYDDINRRKIFAVITIPRGFENDILHGQAVNIPAYGDASSRLTNGLIQQDFRTIYQQVLYDYQSQLMSENGFTREQIDMILQPIKSQTIPLYNASISFAAITFPGLLAMLLQHSMLLASTRVNIALNTLPQGKPPLIVFLGSLSALLPIWLFLSIVLFGLWPWVLGYRQLANLPEIIILTLPFLVAVIGLGKLLTECLRRVEMIYLTLAFVTTPVFYLSGTIWPLEAMPYWVQLFAKMLPSTWGANMMSGVNQMGLSFSRVGFNISMLLLLGTFYASLGFFIEVIRDGRMRRWMKVWRKSLRRRQRLQR